MKKRKSRGRSKGAHGRSGSVQCTSCGRMVPSDKAKRVTTRHSSIIADQTLARELEKQGAIIMGSTVDKYYCISCAVHRGLCNPREASLRKEHTRKRRF